MSSHARIHSAPREHKAAYDPPILLGAYEPAQHAASHCQLDQVLHTGRPVPQFIIDLANDQSAQDCT